MSAWAPLLVSLTYDGLRYDRVRVHGAGGQLQDTRENADRPSRRVRSRGSTTAPRRAGPRTTASSPRWDCARCGKARDVCTPGVRAA